MTKYPKSKEKGIINMKKIIVVILGFSLFCSLALLTQSAVITPDTGYTVYPILKNENVRFYEENGDEILVPDELVGRTVQEMNFRSRFGLNIIAIENNSKVLETIQPDYKFCNKDVLIVSGSRESLLQLSEWAEKH